jgi:DnaJ-domain-containing protein 1
MSRYLGRVLATAVGALAGPVGAAFGFLVGWLIDQFRVSAGVAVRIERFLREPSRERRREHADRFGVAALVVAVMTADGAPRVVQVERALSLPWPGSSARVRLPGKRAVIDQILSSRVPLRPERIVPAFRDWDETRRDELVALLVAVASADVRGVSDAERQVLEEIVLAVGGRPGDIGPLLRRSRGLNEEACRLLGIETDAGEDDIRHAFRRLAAQMHPDTAGDLEPAQRKTMEAAFVKLREAHDHLLRQLRGTG